MTQITEQTLEGYKKEIETLKNRAEAESFLNGLTVKELKALYKYLVMFAYGEWYRMRKAEFIEEILDYYFEREIEESTEDTSEVTEETKAALKNLTAEDDFNGVSVKMIHNNECIENASTESELEDLLNTGDEYTLRYMLHRKGYETEKAEDECVKCELVTAYVKEEMQLRREAKALDKLGHSGLIAKTRELKKQLDACNSECEMEEVLKSYTKAELVMMSANINNYSLKINYLQSRDKLARDFAHEYWFMTRTLHEAEKNLTEKKHITETTENTSCYKLTDEMYKEIYEELNMYRVISRIKCEVAIERKDREMYSSGKEKYEKYASIMKGYFGVLEEYMDSEDREFSKRNALPEWLYEEQAEGNVVYQILSQKGNAKAQQELLKAQGEEYLLDMYLVFDAPVKYSMDTPAELRKYLCQAVLRVRRDKEYGMQLLNMKARNEMQTEDDIRNSKDTIERLRYEERQRRQKEFYDYIEESIKLSA